LNSPLSKTQLRSRQNTLLIGALVSIIAVLCAGLYAVPWTSKILDIGFTDEAKRNPYLAAEQFLTKFNTPVKTETGLHLLDDLPPTHDTLLIASSRRNLSERRVNELIDWIDEGGTLIVLASDLFDEDREDKGDRLLDRFGIWLYEGEASDTEANSSESEAPADETDQDSSKETNKGTNNEVSDEATTQSFADALFELENKGNNCKVNLGQTVVSVAGEERDLLVEFSSTRHLWFEDDQDYAYSYNDIGAQLVSLSHGQGWLYVMTSLAQWRNSNIGCFDHAHLLRALTDREQTLWFLFNTDIEPIHHLIWQQWQVAVTLALVWLGLWLWRGAYRTRRIEPEDPHQRREIMEHISGMSRFLYQQQELDQLLAGLRADCFQGDTNLPGDKDQLAREIARWADQLDIDKQQLHWAMTAKLTQDSNALTDAVVLLQKIRNISKSTH